MKDKYFMAEEKDKALRITIYGDITSWEWEDSDTSSHTLSKLIENSGADEILVMINSYGGETAEGLAIYNALRNHKAKVVTRCDGFACSAASVVFMAGDERLMNEASLLMVHNAWTYASGNAEQLRKEADDLEVISKMAARAYASRMTITEEELQEMLDRESWIPPEEAVEKGFATGIIREGAASRQQYSARRAIMRQLVPEKQSEERPNGFKALFDSFNKKITGGETR